MVLPVRQLTRSGGGFYGLLAITKFGVGPVYANPCELGYCPGVVRINTNRFLIISDQLGAWATVTPTIPPPCVIQTA